MQFMIIFVHKREFCFNIALFTHLNKMVLLSEKNRTLKDTARTMLCDSKLPVFFWAEAINTACYVQNRVLINKAQMKTPYEILYGWWFLC